MTESKKQNATETDETDLNTDQTETPDTDADQAEGEVAETTEVSAETETESSEIDATTDDIEDAEVIAETDDTPADPEPVEEPVAETPPPPPLPNLWSKSRVGLGSLPCCWAGLWPLVWALWPRNLLAPF